MHVFVACTKKWCWFFKAVITSGPIDDTTVGGILTSSKGMGTFNIAWILDLGSSYFFLL